MNRLRLLCTLLAISLLTLLSWSLLWAQESSEDGDRRDYRLAYNPLQNEFLLAFEEYDGDGWQVGSALLAANGSEISGTANLHTSGGGESGGGSLSAVVFDLSSNSYVLLWSENNDDSELITQRIAADGSTQGAATVLNTGSSGQSALAVHPESGRLLLVYLTGGNPYSLYARVFNAAFEAIGGEFAIGEGSTAESFTDPAAVYDADTDTFLVVYAHRGTGPLYTVSASGVLSKVGFTRTNWDEMAATPGGTLYVVDNGLLASIDSSSAEVTELGTPDPAPAALAYKSGTLYGVSTTSSHSGAYSPPTTLAANGDTFTIDLTPGDDFLYTGNDALAFDVSQNGGGTISGVMDSLTGNHASAEDFTGYVNYSSVQAFVIQDYDAGADQEYRTADDNDQLRAVELVGSSYYASATPISTYGELYAIPSAGMVEDGEPDLSSVYVTPVGLYTLAYTGSTLYGTGNEESDLEARRVTASGSLTGSAFVLSAAPGYQGDTNYNGGAASVAVDPEGGAALTAWIDNRDAGQLEPWIQGFETDGSLHDHEFGTNPATSNYNVDSGESDLARAVFNGGNQRFRVVWQNDSFALTSQLVDREGGIVGITVEPDEAIDYPEDYAVAANHYCGNDLVVALHGFSEDETTTTHFGDCDPDYNLGTFPHDAPEGIASIDGDEVTFQVRFFGSDLPDVAEVHISDSGSSSLAAGLLGNRQNGLWQGLAGSGNSSALHGLGAMLAVMLVAAMLLLTRHHPRHRWAIQSRLAVLLVGAVFTLACASSGGGGSGGSSGDGDGGGTGGDGDRSDVVVEMTRVDSGDSEATDGVLYQAVVDLGAGSYTYTFVLEAEGEAAEGLTAETWELTVE